MNDFSDLVNYVLFALAIVLFIFLRGVSFSRRHLWRFNPPVVPLPPSAQTGPLAAVIDAWRPRLEYADFRQVAFLRTEGASVIRNTRTGKTDEYRVAIFARVHTPLIFVIGTYARERILWTSVICSGGRTLDQSFMPGSMNEYAVGQLLKRNENEWADEFSLPTDRGEWCRWLEITLCRMAERAIERGIMARRGECYCLTWRQAARQYLQGWYAFYQAAPPEHRTPRGFEVLRGGDATIAPPPPANE